MHHTSCTHMIHTHMIPAPHIMHTYYPHIQLSSDFFGCVSISSTYSGELVGQSVTNTVRFSLSHGLHKRKPLPGMMANVVLSFANIFMMLALHDQTLNQVWYIKAIMKPNLFDQQFCMQLTMKPFLRHYQGQKVVLSGSDRRG